MKPYKIIELVGAIFLLISLILIFSIKFIGAGLIGLLLGFVIYGIGRLIKE